MAAKVYSMVNLLASKAEEPTCLYICVRLPALIEHQAHRIPHPLRLQNGTRSCSVAHKPFSRLAESMVVTHRESKDALHIGLVDITKTGQLGKGNLSI